MPVPSAPQQRPAEPAPGGRERGPFDVAVLGGHFAPAMLAAILARSGARVLLLNAAGDGAEPAGQSTVPYTSEVFALLAERFGVPEIAAFAHFPDLPSEVRERSGIKKSLGFLYHTPGSRHAPGRTVQFNVPGEHNELHVFRPAAEQYLREVAERYGAHRPPGDPVVTAVEVDERGALVTASDGSVYEASYVVDASGPHSPLLAGLGVPVRSDRLRLRSRLLATRMKGVRPFEQLAPLSGYPGATRWSAGTFHHLFDGGWIEVVDFGNHDESANDLCAVSVAVDPRRFADLPAEPERAFRALIARFPSIDEQFTDAVAVEDWVAGPVDEPWQRSVATVYGPRWFAMERSAARTEELLARDVTVGAEIVHAVAAGLLRVLRGGTSAKAEFARVAEFQAALIDFNDAMLAAVRTASADFELFNAFSRVWLLWQILGDLSLKRARMDAAAGTSWAPVERFESGALWFRTPRGLSEIIQMMFEEMERVRSGVVSPHTAARRIFKSLRGAACVPPLYRFADPGARYYHFTFARRLLMLLWVKTVAPRDFRRLLTRDNVTARRLPPVLELPPDHEREPRLPRAQAPAASRPAPVAAAPVTIAVAASGAAAGNDRDGE